MMAFSAGGRWLATCSALKPPQEMPIMPTVPLHQGCAASQAITSTASACSCGRYSSRAGRRNRRSRACRRAPPHSHGRRNRHASGGRAAPCRRAADMADIRGWQAPDRSSGIVGQPDRRGEPGAVGKRDPLGRDGADRRGKSFRSACVAMSMRREPAATCSSGELARISSGHANATRRWLRKRHSCRDGG